MKMGAATSRSAAREGRGPSDDVLPDLRDCVRQVRRRNEDAARTLMDRLYPLVLKVVRAHLPWRTSEEDLVQTVFMKVFANLHQNAGQVPVAHWVSRIAVEKRT